jgi:signal transduction histidine kinase
MQRLHPEYRIQELSVTGDPMPNLGVRDTYFPVQYFVPGEFLASAVPAEDGNPFELGLGIDAGSNPAWKASLTQSIRTDAVGISDFIRVQFEDIVIGQAFVIAVPVHTEGDARDATGVVAAPMIDVILPTELDMSLASDVTWDIASAAEGFTDDADGMTWTGRVDLPGVSWQLRVQPSRSGAGAVAGTPFWLVLALGLGSTALAAIVAQLLRQRARSRARLAELQRHAEDKDRFLAAVSHEIRTPLTAVAGFAHELRDRPDDFGPDEARMLLGMVAEQSDEVAAIVEDLLVAARSDIGKVSVHGGRIDARHEARVALETSGTDARFADEHSPTVWADPQRVRQIIRNLLTNAARYGGPNIEIRFDVGESWAEITIADDGEAIPREETDRIFDPYTSANVDGENVGAIGLGLYISRKLATVMGGHLGYRHDGEWGMFTLRLPRVSPGPAGAARVGDAAPTTKDRELQGLAGEVVQTS